MAKIPYAMAIGNWLPYSETFIYDQVKHAERYMPYVIARGLNPARENFPYDHVTSLNALQRTLYYAALPCGKFIDVIRESGAKFIHAHFGTNGALVAATARKTDKPLIVTLHGVDVGILLNPHIPIDYLFYKRTYKRMFETAQLLLPASQELADCLVQLGEMGKESSKDKKDPNSSAIPLNSQFEKPSEGEKEDDEEIHHPKAPTMKQAQYPRNIFSKLLFLPVGKCLFYFFFFFFFFFLVIFHFFLFYSGSFWN